MSDIFETLVALQPSGSAVKARVIERVPGISPSVKSGLVTGRQSAFGGAVQKQVSGSLSAVVAAVQNRSASLSAVVAQRQTKTTSLDGVVDLFATFTKSASLNAGIRLPTTLLSGTLAYWKLDGNSSDSLGVANGTDTAVTYSVPNGKINQGAGFNGSSSRIDCGNSIPLDSNNWTMSAWSKASSLPTFARWFSYADNGPTFWHQSGAMSIVQGGSILFGCNITISTVAFQHIVVTRAGSTIRAYLNGVQTAQNLAFASVFTKNSNTFLGCRPSGPSEFFPGAIDEAGIWNRALSALEVTDLYNAGLGLQYPF